MQKPVKIKGSNIVVSYVLTQSHNTTRESMPSQ